jgi:hypothetical protein
LEQVAVGELRKYLSPYLKRHPFRGGPRFGADVVEFALLRIQAEIAREISRAHIAGYSTNARDLLHDLIP